jgi:division protein CdvB (Snf7/Vps24/ESCRT-III family)
VEGLSIKSLLNPTPPPVKELASKSIFTLRVQQNKLEQASNRLRERDRILFESCTGALKKNNKEKAAICANELAEVRKLLKFLYNVQLAIERVVLRLETIKELSDIVIDLKPALKLLQNVSQDLFQVLPDVSTELDNVNSAISDTLYATKITTDENIVPVGHKTEAGEQILKEVTSFIEDKIAQTLPEPPKMSSKTAEKPGVKELVALSTTCSQVMSRKTNDADDEDSSHTIFYKKSEIKEMTLKVDKQPSVEDMLLEYVRKTNGEINMSKCSQDLKTSNSEIEKALENLGTKGKIKIELKSPE